VCAEHSNLEVVRAGLEAWKRRDFEAVAELLDPDVELVPIRAVLEGEAYRGHDGFQRFLEDMADDWEHFGTEGGSLRELSDGRVLVVARFHARGRASGVEVDTPGAWVCDVRAGKILRLQFYADEEAALAATGGGG
jgi:ketosteroid isomerase-like protein